jgi:alpha-1,6-mannosyltransferase
MSPAAIRYLGLAGSVALGVDAYLSGALRTMPLHGDPKSIASGPNGVLIMALWILGTAALAGAWWLGRRLIRSTRWTVVTAALWMLPMLVIPPISSRDVYAYSCQGALYAAGGNPYHQGVSSLPCQWLDSISAIWRD